MSGSYPSERPGGPWLLVSGASRTIERLRGVPGLGILLTPAAGNGVTWARRLGMPWAVDNAAFSGFSVDAYSVLLGRVFRKLMTDSSLAPPLWVTAPDVVGNSDATLRLFEQWQPLLAERGLPIALVAQDGLTCVAVPWESIACIFIGGSTTWKLSPAARLLALEAKRRGLLVHMGRVNTRRRIFTAVSWGIDSVDGSAFSRFPDAKIPQALSWIAEANLRAPLFPHDDDSCASLETGSASSLVP